MNLPGEMVSIMRVAFPRAKSNATMLTEYRTLLISLFESLQRLKADPYGRAREGMAIQNALFEQIMAAEGRIRNTKQLASSVRERLSTPQPVRPTKAEAQSSRRSSLPTRTPSKPTNCSLISCATSETG